MISSAGAVRHVLPRLNRIHHVSVVAAIYQFNIYYVCNACLSSRAPNWLHQQPWQIEVQYILRLMKQLNEIPAFRESAMLKYTCHLLLEHDLKLSIQFSARVRRENLYKCQYCIFYDFKRTKCVHVELILDS